MNQRNNSVGGPIPQREYNLKRLAITVVCMMASFPILCCGGVGLIEYVEGVDPYKIDSLKPGMTESDVLDLVGRPYEINRDGEWLYRVHSDGLFNERDPRAVTFEKDGNVSDVHIAHGTF